MLRLAWALHLLLLPLLLISSPLDTLSSPPILAAGQPNREIAGHRSCALTVDTTTTPVSCHGGDDGSLLAIPIGGTAPYVYTWTGNGVNSVDSSVSGVQKGSYQISVQDAKGCLALATATVTEPDELQATINTSHVSCSGYGNGSAQAAVTGGTAPYQYHWSKGSPGVGSTVGQLNGGPVSLTVEDANGCLVNELFTITEPAPLSVLSNVTDVSCHGESDGAISLAVSGGKAPYTLSPTSLAGLPKGNYPVEVSDKNGCKWNDTFAIDQPDSALQLSIQVIEASCRGCFNGAVLGQATGGTWPYTYYGELHGLDSGHFYTANIRVIDSRGCSQTEVKTGTILPVELLAFRGKYQSGQVYLGWETQSELNNKGFDIRRMVANGTSFESLGFVAGNGTSSAHHYYEFIDSTPSTYVMNHYQLKQMDYNGDVDYSLVLSVDPVRREDPSIALIHQSNPGQLSIRSTQSDALFIQISDINGKVLLAENNTFESYISTAFWPSGTYLVSIRNEHDKYYTEKIVLVK